ncbi:ATP-dependent helicase [Ramlibacter sp. USB13]|uniref:DNA 3'-5' helicase n=1 Tax=Ramlibacter cellulosilyticus TaxID=2764187 RepID=A0A923SAC9_9BURK|nr:UvrD-helicase domain-containing protein [Ramlibacter cellulosilyticus]MBC5782651.1 ATP-dependent helicase [Ramlibacter cellulosilyticus]
MTERMHAVAGQLFEANPEQLAVIGAGSDEWLLVVAGPGTGKTQVAAMRLVHLLEEGLQPAQILVLSFSRSAVATLSKRLVNLRLSDQGVIEDLRHLAIRTFDSWAFRVLRQSGEPVNELMSRTYEQNITAVTRMLDDSLNPIGDRLANIRHVIVDEFQDLPGVRAAMVASLLQRLNGNRGGAVGFTVLGDPVQAIYRFAARSGDQPLPEDPWEDLKRRMGPNLRELALTRNYRATEKLAAAAASLRKILGTPALDAGRKLEAMQRFLARMPTSTTDAKLGPSWLLQLPEGSLAILTRTNGEALRVWKMLLGDALEPPAIAVTLRLAGGRPPVPPWIAAVLSTFRHPTISRKVFDVVHAKARERLPEGTAANGGVPPLEIAWRRLARASGASDSALALDLDELRNRLAWPDAFPDDQIDDEAVVHITTVHQAKGMEFDNVALLDAQNRDSTEEPEDPLEQAHVGFVAVTRAGRHMGRLPNTCIFKPLTSRSFRGGRSRLVEWGAWTGKARWIQVQMGLEGDIELTSFVSLDLHKDEQGVASLQEVLAGSVSAFRNRKVVLSQAKAEGTSARARDIRYDIRLQQQDGEGLFLGRTSSQVTQDLLDLLWEPGYAIPRNIYNLRIAEVVSVAVNAELAESIPQPWHSSRIWLGITLAGTGDFKTWKRHAK